MCHKYSKRTNNSTIHTIPTSRNDKMKRRSTRTHRKEEEEENSGDSDAATTTKPTSRALKCIQAFNKSGNVEDTTKTTVGDSHSYRSEQRTFLLRGKQKGRGRGGGVRREKKRKQQHTIIRIWSWLRLLLCHHRNHRRHNTTRRFTTTRHDTTRS